LHVPLRLDVYYQHPDQRRELLERWCLEYAPAHFQQQLETFSSDPIVQLRHVCKKIVIWLRTLYCWSRMLPSQALRGSGTIGFSIYVVSEGNDDVSSLISNQGFCAQGQPSSVVTPYGELGWKVFYAPKSIVERFLPQQDPYKTTPARPISIPTPHPAHDHHFRRDSAPTAVQSAPSQNRKVYQRAHSSVTPPHSKPLLSVIRSNSGVGDAPPSTYREEQYQSFQAVETRPPSMPSKNLSGLSLAMMMSDEQDKDSSESTTAATNAATNDQVEKRRAALHHAPPQLSMNNNADQMGTSPGMKKSLTSAGEYGYAYNNHIPWQQIRPHSNATTNNRVSPMDQERTASPSPLQVGTPPTGLLGATPPTGGFLGGATPTMINHSGLIPPRSAVTPPFVRPMGFVGEPPSQPLPPPAESSHATPPASSHATPSHHNGARPVTSLDLLHSSPFLQHPGGSLLSSLSVQDPINTNSVLSGDLRMQAEAALHSYDDHYHPHYEDDDDMPFAVDLPPETGGPADSRTGGDSSSHLAASSAAVTSFAHRCATANRLALFDSVQQQQKAEAKVDMVSSLADQLAEFKTFGASLMEKASESAGDVSTSTPISLRI
jgi:hypothetical protein